MVAKKQVAPAPEVICTSKYHCGNAVEPEAVAKSWTWCHACRSRYSRERAAAAKAKAPAKVAKPKATAKSVTKALAKAGATNVSLKPLSKTRPHPAHVAVIPPQVEGTTSDPQRFDAMTASKAAQL